MGVIYALLSGSLASAIGYAIWYWVRVRMTAISAAISADPERSAGGLILNEEIALRSAVSALMTLGGSLGHLDSTRFEKR